MFQHLLRAAAAAALIGGLAGSAFAATPAPEAAPQSAPAAPAAQTAPAGAAADPVVARVDGQDIHRSDVLRTIAGLPQQIQQMPIQMVFPAVVDQLINAKLAAKAGYAEKLDQDSEVKDRLKQAEDQIVEEIYITRAVDKAITPAMLQQQYQDYLKQNPPQEEVKASHILVKTEAEAKKIIEQLNNGADFAALAKEKSTDKAAAAHGGDLGYFTRGDMVKPFSDAAFALKPGTYTQTPVKTQFGWHVIKVEDKRTQPAPTFDSVKDQLKNDLSQKIAEKILTDLRSHAKIERFQFDGAPLPAQPAPGDAAQPGQGDTAQPAPGAVQPAPGGDAAQPSK